MMGELHFLNQSVPFGRAIPRHVAGTANGVQLDLDDVTECVVDTLTDYPEAYEAMRKALQRKLEEKRARRGRP